MDLGAGFSVSRELLLYSSVVGLILLEVIFDCSFVGTIFECIIVDLSIIPNRK